ncbi:MAG: PDZ domain-containing protein [Longimicrobiaceae bacterium]
MPLTVSEASGRLRMADYPVVAGVKRGGGAWRAGVRDGDEVLAVNGLDARELPAIAGLGRREPGTRYTVQIRRDGVVRNFTAELDPPRSR